MQGGRRAHEPAELTLTVSRAQGGRLVLRTPLTPGWAYSCATPAELARGVEQAYAEAAIAAYARLRGALYDLAETEETIPASAYPAGRPHPAERQVDEVAARRRRSKHPTTHPPELWVELDDGRWLSPSGRRYGPDTAVVASVRAARGS